MHVLYIVWLLPPVPPVQLGYLDHVIYLHWHAGTNVA